MSSLVADCALPPSAHAHLLVVQVAPAVVAHLRARADFLAPAHAQFLPRLLQAVH